MTQYRASFEGGELDPGLGTSLTPTITSVVMPMAHLTGENAIAVWQPAVCLIADDAAHTGQAVLSVLMQRTMQSKAYTAVIEALDETGEPVETWRMENTKVSVVKRPQGIAATFRYDLATRIA